MVIIAVFSTQIAFSQSFHAYECMVTKCQIRDEKLVYPLGPFQEGDPGLVTNTDIQIKFYSDKTIAYIHDNETVKGTFNHIESNVNLVEIAGKELVMVILKSPYIEGEYIVVRYPYMTIDKLAGEPLLIYYCQLLK